MLNTSYDLIKRNIYMSQQRLLKLVNNISEEHLAHQFIPMTPPIGWHVWHLARCADRLQFHLVNRSKKNHSHQEIWHKENLAVEWKLRPEVLGVAEAGIGMASNMTTAISQVAKKPLLEYAQRTFKATDRALDMFYPGEFEQQYRSIQDYDASDESFVLLPDRVTTIADDLLHHISHLNLHLGAIETLRSLSAAS
jgi:hypothetical protein